MMRKFGKVLIVMAMALCLVGCGDKDKEKETTNNAATEEVKAAVDIDVTSCAKSILDGCDFKDNLAEVDNKIALTRLYNLDENEIEAAAFYTNTNATAEEIAVIKVKNEAYVATVKDEYGIRVDMQKSACKDYLPDEMPKLESAIIYENGNYVVLCISNDNAKAKDVIANLFK